MVQGIAIACLMCFTVVNIGSRVALAFAIGCIPPTCYLGGDRAGSSVDVILQRFVGDLRGRSAW